MRKTAILLALACALARADYGPGTTDSDLLRSGTPVVTNAWLAVSNETVRIARSVAGDAGAITDGTNRIDATRDVWRMFSGRVCTNASEVWTYSVGGATYTAEQMADAVGGGDSGYSQTLAWMNSSFIGKDGEEEQFEGWFVIDGSGLRPVGYSYTTGETPESSADHFLAIAEYVGLDYTGGTNVSITAFRGTFESRTNYVGRLALTNDLPGAVSADLTPATNYANQVGARVASEATNYTDAALGAFAATGTVARATVYGTPTRWTDATGCVWEVIRDGYTDWFFGGTGWRSGHVYEVSVVPYEGGGYAYALYQDGETVIEYYLPSDDELEITFDTDGGVITAMRSAVYETNLVGRVALTNDIPDVSGYATQLQSTNAAVAVADAKISTNNAAFVSAVTNCPVVIASGGGGGDGFPAGDWSDYGTLGALLAAIVAAITWLKNNQRYALHTVTLTNGAGTLLDRAGNRAEVSGDTTLTLPAAVAGYARDFLVRLEISGSTVPTITFAAPTGETITYETDGDEFPVPDEAGSWLYSFTESCVAHKFAVSLKKVNVVAQSAQ